MFNIASGGRILLLAPHTDDVEICSGGAVAHMARLGCELKYIAFSNCPESVPEGMPKDILATEARAATKELGIKESMVEIKEFPVRNFGSYRQEILDHLIQVRAEFRPDVVICPSRYDVHQDHKTICDEALRAFRGSSILGYEAPWNNFSMRHDMFIELAKSDLDIKMKALKCFKSQEFRSYFTEEYISSIARVRGQQAGYDFAEAFEVIRIRVNS